VKTLCADASVDFVDVKVGHCQALNLMKTKPSPVKAGEGFFMGGITVGRRVAGSPGRRVAGAASAGGHFISGLLIS
jgi:hypothetical protein